MRPFGENLRRLMGLHNLRVTNAAELVGISAQALSDLSRGKRDPNLRTLMLLADFFEVPADRLVQAGFADLLVNELGNADRYERVEAKVKNRAGRSQSRPKKKSA